MKHLSKLFSLLLLASLSATVNADEAAVRKTLQKLMPSSKIDSLKPSAVKGLYEVMQGTNIFYVSDDGLYLLQGNIIDVNAKKNITDEKLAGARVAALDKIGTDKMIIFKPEKSKYTVSVFTDIDCGYCRKLHSEIDQYMAEGITIRYLFYPRAGKGSDSYNKAISVWCADDRNAALTLAKSGKIPEPKTCDNPVDETMRLGNEFGVRGTPMLVTEKGTIFPGYVPAKQLAQALRLEMGK